jgi:hypothetical protein
MHPYPFLLKGYPVFIFREPQRGDDDTWIMTARHRPKLFAIAIGDIVVSFTTMSRQEYISHRLTGCRGIAT